MPGPILFCYDGSQGSQMALRSAGELLARPADGFVLTIWQPLSFRLAAAGTFAPLPLSDEAKVDKDEEAYARGVAEEGARLAHEHGYDLTALVEQADESIAHAILAVADRYDVALIVCGQRGRGLLRSTLLGSVSHALSAHTRRPVLISPEPH
ncbi:MAG: universal stress protein [Acidimicrobiales bacterium]|nr:universal stress protein [Acidimicrobiales bacterium]